MSAAVKVKLIKKRKRESEGREGSQSERRKIVKYTHCVTRTKPRTLVSLASYLTFDILKTLCIFSHICLTKWRRRGNKGSRGVENREQRTELQLAVVASKHLTVLAVVRFAVYVYLCHVVRVCATLRGGN